MDVLKQQIRDRAGEIARYRSEDDAAGVQVDVGSLGLAVDELLQGRSVAERPGFFDLFPPFTCVCALLCLAFAGFGLLFPLFADSVAGAGKGSALVAGFLDIAKIFAGAIVGSTSSVVLAASRTRRQG
ncbi:hypothetical protein [Chromobacterium piscinae]|uniref:Uncharacterized protein n=1 Tax=Chromobacterium piscinae TaxID=686831 RepID=A0ABV0H6U1_9NEIS|nr:hypothetical protein [Chromobacterium piscinae]MBX9298674.1 hypothetical protein [Chromobacterium vaccinii]MBX9347198.1 hypothetical protein [Chromobacterium vaccinii]MBX9355952.1 hypothetical protein [Chromobacterium vaccinii]MCD4504415.1 hypothetical protein [Chromobacterium piscinae]MCD5329335.1 hypothetical protein [Chromobacterium piscinae]